MSRAPVALLGILALGLGGLVAWQLSGSAPGPEAAPRTAPALPTAPPSGGGRGPDGAGLAEASLVRPLFNADRRPVPAGSAGPMAATSLPRLTGVLVTPAGRSAIFAGTPRSLVVQEGAAVAGFTVSAIEPGQVTLLGPGGARVLRPSGDPNRPAAPPPGSAPVPALGGEPGPFPAGPNAPQDGMPFDQTPAPSGLAIIRNLAPPQRGTGTLPPPPATAR